MGVGITELTTLITAGSEAGKPAAELKYLLISIGLILVLFFAGLMWEIFWRIRNDRIDISRLISEGNGNASLSRFQMLIFTFTIAMSFLIKVLETKGNAFPHVDVGVLALLGISGGTYVLAKNIQKGMSEKKDSVG